MTINISLASANIEEQIKKLEQYPQIAVKNFLPALRMSVAALDAAIRPFIPTLTGRARSTFQSKAGGTRIDNLVGQVGWFETNDYPFYINIVENGAREHPLAGKSKSRSIAQRSRFEKKQSRGGSFKGQHYLIRGFGWVTKAIHPGFGARGFMAAGLASSRPTLDTLFGAANEAVANDLAVAA